MLTHIHVRSFVIVKSLSLDFQSGLHVLTGETGAGKSIWVDALQIALGERADAQVISNHSDTCEISLCFDLNKLPEAKQFLTTENIDANDECVIRRIIYRDKPSRTTINGIPVSQHTVRELSQLLICVHSQHQHQRLLKSNHQRDLLDHYGKLSKLLFSIHKLYTQWKTLEDERQALKNQAKTSDSDLTLWQYQLTEIQSLQLKHNEFNTLFHTYQTLQKSQQVITTLTEIRMLIGENDDHPAAMDLMHRALQKFQSLRTDNKTLENIQSLLETAVIHVTEAHDALRDFNDTIDFQLSQLNSMETRLTQIQDIARKHHVEPDQLPDVEKSLQKKIEDVQTIETRMGALAMEQARIEKIYHEKADELSHQRKKAAKKMGDEITAEMQLLGMPGGQCQISCNSLPPGIYLNGNESVVFLMATNPGQSPQPLSQTLSGGELSRLSLITHVLTAQINSMPTMIFDEVDVGIGGKTADVVGRLLRQLSDQTQVLCITHLAQVAACGHHHFKAEKITADENTNTEITLLNDADRAQEIARMLSGASITEKSLSHAHELLAMQIAE